jgi:hypothetical protein
VARPNVKACVVRRAELDGRDAFVFDILDQIGMEAR